MLVIELPFKSAVVNQDKCYKQIFPSIYILSYKSKGTTSCSDQRD